MATPDPGSKIRGAAPTDLVGYQRTAFAVGLLGAPQEQARSAPAGPPPARRPGREGDRAAPSLGPRPGDAGPWGRRPDQEAPPGLPGGPAGPGEPGGLPPGPPEGGDQPGRPDPLAAGPEVSGGRGLELGGPRGGGDRPEHLRLVVRPHEHGPAGAVESEDEEVGPLPAGGEEAGSGHPGPGAADGQVGARALDRGPADRPGGRLPGEGAHGGGGEADREGALRGPAV